MSPFHMEPMLQDGSKNSKWGDNDNEVDDLVKKAKELEEAEAQQEIVIDPERKENLINQLNVSIILAPFVTVIS